MSRRMGRAVRRAPALALREHVGDEAVAHVVGERAEDPLRLLVSSGDQGEALQRDHRVAAPIREPVVPGDHGAHVVADGAGARDVLDAARGRDDELVGGDREVRRHRVVVGRAPGVEQEMAPRVLELQHLAVLQGEHRLPALRGAGQGDLLAGGEPHLEVPGAPQRPACVVAAALLHAEEELRARARIMGERRGRSLHAQTQGRQVRAGRDLVAALHRGQDVRLLVGVLERRLVRPEVDLRPQAQARGHFAAGVAVVHVDGVLSVGKDHALLDQGGADAEYPDGQARIEAELLQVFRARQGRGRLFVLLAPQAMTAPVRKVDLGRDVVEHHRPSEGRGQGRHEESVEAARGHAADRARSVAAETVGDQPLPGEQVGPAGAFPAGPRVTADDFLHAFLLSPPAPRVGSRSIPP